MKTLSVAIITLNEEANISRCLASLGSVADEIVVVDSGSSDRTKEICSKVPGLRWIESPWEGFVTQKNRAWSQCTGDLVLSLDADEFLSEETRDHIAELKLQGTGSAWFMNRLTRYEDRWIRHGGWFPDWQLRLAPRLLAHWSGGRVHESLKVAENVKCQRLRGIVEHHTCSSETEHRARIRYYAGLAAKDLASKPRWRLKINSFLGPVFRLLKGYIFRLGFLDGAVGWRIAWLSAWGVWLKNREALKGADN